MAVNAPAISVKAMYIFTSYGSVHSEPLTTPGKGFSVKTPGKLETVPVSRVVFLYMNFKVCLSLMNSANGNEVKYKPTQNTENSTATMSAGYIRKTLAQKKDFKLLVR